MELQARVCMHPHTCMCDLGLGHSSALSVWFQIQSLIQDEKSVKIDFLVSCI